MFYERVARPLLFQLDPESTHRRTIDLARRISHSASLRAMLQRWFDWQAPELAVDAIGLSFRNPIGLAAGFDKHADIYPLIPDLGFGHMEIGSVSLLAWRGNPSPTLLRLPVDHALINRLGLNSHGAEAVAARLEGSPFKIPTGLNLVKTADPAIAGEEAIRDYVSVIERFRRIGAFITLNLSCPNSADGRSFEDASLFTSLMAAIDKSAWRSDDSTGKLLVKLSPDLKFAELDTLIEIAESYNVSGYVISNTTARRDRLNTPREHLNRFGAGGLSGAPLKPYTMAMLRHVAGRVDRSRVLVACGGVGCDPAVDPASEVWDYLSAGASLVQLHTGLIYSGPSIVSRINKGLVGILHKIGASSLRDYLANRCSSNETSRISQTG